VKSHENKPN